MSTDEMRKILSWIQAEWGLKINQEDQKGRFDHWFRELGEYDFEAVKRIVRRLSTEQFPPRPGKIIAELEKEPHQEALKTDERTTTPHYEVNKKSKTVTVYGSNSIAIVSGAAIKNIYPYAFLEMLYKLTKDKSALKAIKKMAFPEDAETGERKQYEILCQYLGVEP